MAKFKVEKGTVQETLMMPLNGRAYCGKHFPKTFPNQAAIDVIKNVDYDFSLVEGPELNMVTWALRARLLAERAAAYLKTHPHATIINLGCGLDLSFDEVDNGTCRWINMDLPDVIAARESIVSLKNEREMNFAGDLMDFSWMETIQKPPYSVSVSDGVYIISGGVLMYFHTEDMRRFFLQLLKMFPGGGIAFDGENKSGMKKSNKVVQKTGNGTKIYFPIENAEALFRGWSPDFRSVTEIRRLPSYVRKYGEVPFRIRFILSLGLALGMVRIIDVGF